MHLDGADIFVGVSAPNIVTADMVNINEQRCNSFCNGKPGS